MGESVFSLRKKPPRLTKGVPACSFPSRRLSSGRRKCSRADCASRVLPLRAWASSRRVVFASAPPSPIPLFSRQALPSSSVPSRPASWSVPAAGRAGHDLSHGLKARRYSCSFVPRRQLTLKGAQTPRTSAVRNCRGKQFRTLKSYARRKLRPARPSSGRLRPFVRTGAAFLPG